MVPIDELLTVDTPENVSFDFEIAGIGSRFLAALVDTSLILILQALVFAVGILVTVGLKQDVGSLSSYLENDPTWFLAITGMVSFLFLWGYYIFFEMIWNGQSPGKRLSKMRVIRVDGRPVTLSESLIRNLVRLIDFLPGFYGVGVMAMFIQPQSRRLGDLAAGTLVVHEKAKFFDLASLEAPEMQIVLPISLSDSINGLPMERLSGSDLHMVEEYLHRYKKLENAEALGLQMVTFLWDKMDLSTETIPHQSAVDILAAIRNRK
ncbi:MAG: RDD family protein [Anaerolineaceae bacterium]